VAGPIVFFDIAGPDDAVLRSFYATVFGWRIDGAGQFSVSASSLLLVAKSGGAVEGPRFEVPGVVVLGLFRDPAGNTMGLVEMDGDRPRIP